MKKHSFLLQVEISYHSLSAKANRERSKRIMAIRIEPRLVKVVSTPIESKTRKGEMFQMIVDVGTTARPDHWYMNMYKTEGYQDLSRIEAALCAEKGDELYIFGSVRKFEYKGAYGVVIDVEDVLLRDDFEEDGEIDESIGEEALASETCEESSNVAVADHQFSESGLQDDRIVHQGLVTSRR